MTDPLRDTPPPPGYWPPTPNQFREPSVDDCTWYAGEFAWQAGSKTHHSMHPVNELRASSTDKVGGTPISVMMRDTSNIWPAQEHVGWSYGAYTAEHLKNALRGGAVLVVGGNYDNLPLHYRRWTTNDSFAHAIALKFLLDDGRTRMYDPLGGGPARATYDGEWIDFPAIFKPTVGGFCWKDGSGRFLVGIVQNLDGDESMNNLFLPPANPTTKQVRLKEGTEGYAKPSITSKRSKIFWTSTIWRWHLGNTGDGWAAIAVQSDQDNLPDWYTVYVLKNDIIESRLIEADPTPDVEAYKKAIQTLNDQLLIAEKELTLTEADLADADRKLTDIAEVLAG